MIHRDKEAKVPPLTEGLQTVMVTLRTGDTSFGAHAPEMTSHPLSCRQPCLNLVGDTHKRFGSRRGFDEKKREKERHERGYWGENN